MAAGDGLVVHCTHSNACKQSQVLLSRRGYFISADHLLTQVTRVSVALQGGIHICLQSLCNPCLIEKSFYNFCDIDDQ